MGRAMIDTGDIIKHKETGEEWLVAYVEDGRLACIGWPLSIVPVADCELIRKATSQQRQEWLERMADMRNAADPRCAFARKALGR